MIKSMYSGISGMKNFQTKLDVIGNNIANVNTYGFKKSRVTFQDLVSQQLAGATAAQADGRGGINSKQVGAGSSLGSIDTIHEGSTSQFTGRSLDLSIEGEGYFAVTDGDQTFYTRSGNFYLDEGGYLVTAEGYRVLGSDDQTISVIDMVGGDLNDISSFSIGKDGSINIVGSNEDVVVDERQIGLVKFANTSGLSKSGGNLFVPTANSGQPSAIGAPGANGTGAINASSLEMSNVDLSEEFTEMIVAQRGFQSNSKIITTSDEILQELLNLKR
ncbi:flagellar basal body rod protein FlgG [Alkalicoccobacillus plakortidis]|uniref:Flagellar basal body rod protein FlgG n=1 Tax=Alkalicoccobacillus plakortidis TaxID=444060 RepID=A0ABT0XFP5_9BACI|nr:flagellar basal body rod protein FlgG [Alkalicoccobacillus plakortidis]MCM2674733.1 flagellar basal body rod protein FlgG [Alkalicoccobacillus plakortidis]